MKATFKGQNKSGYVAYWGYVFPCGEAVEIEGAAVAAAKRHPEFTVSGKSYTEEELAAPDDAPPSASEDALLESLKAFDHDGDGKPGGSKPKRKYTRKAK